MDAVAHDHQLRTLLRTYLSERVTVNDLLVEEFQLAFGAVRADLALVNGHLEGFEIKAGKDTLTRLPHQVVAYNKVFEFCWVVTTKAHLADARHLVPREWGLLVAHANDLGSTLKSVRTAKRNGRRDGNHLARLLWRDELLAKLTELGLSQGLKSKPKIALFAALAAALPVDELADYVRNCLKTRVDWRAGAKPRECGDSSHPVAIV
ncbi:MAG: sce7726 family protein [Rhodoferax sp.]|uniref:sce7726 family protein n=1 Tax=Rhodoferax sp. TaxID=50421 RepID=UPI00263167A4|nr:sce7726 family protein [Rhodoferax sp.]MDD5335513.1 sce7726 family protein [Rhodoferax sp.]